MSLLCISNSVAEIPSLNNYNTPVCYGNLVCHNETSAGDNCANPNEKVVVRLNDSTNAYISNEEVYERNQLTIDGRRTKEIFEKGNQIYNDLRAQIRERLRTQYEAQPNPLKPLK